MGRDYYFENTLEIYFKDQSDLNEILTLERKEGYENIKRYIPEGETPYILYIDQKSGYYPNFEEKYEQVLCGLYFDSDDEEKMDTIKFLKSQFELELSKKVKNIVIFNESGWVNKFLENKYKDILESNDILKFDLSKIKLIRKIKTLNYLN